jgi:iron complex outermembrane recepter protein
MKKICTLFILIILVGLISGKAFSQQLKKPVAEMSKEEMSTLTYENLMTLSLEDLMTVANKFGLSADEIMEYFLNKNVTSASKHAEKSLNSPLSTTVISKEDILNSGATCIPEALRLVPGMIVREKTNGNYDVHIRGNDNLPPKGMFVYSENSISLVMIDGRPVYNYAFGGTFWETLPIDLVDVERIEVIRGPSSALYGPNAVSGAINIITRTVEAKKPHMDGQIQLGNNNSKFASLSASAGISDKLKVRLSGNYTRLNRFENGYYVFDRDQKYSAKEMETLKQYWNPDKKGLFVEENFDKVFPDTLLATERFGGNAFISYAASKDINMNLAMGIQQSDIVSNSLGNDNIPLVGRTSHTQYVDFRSKLYGLQAQINYMAGDQEVQKAYQGWHIAPKVLNASLEYEYTLGHLIVRPGASFQNTVYNDDQWVDVTQHAGFLNGPKTIRSFAYYLRADYKLFDKLRLIGALRADKYNAPDKTYPTYQFITSYDINANNVIRAVYSRANRGPFISDTYANYSWQVIPGTYTLHYEGNQNLKLPVMDMFELGYRTKLSKNIMVELEAFHSITKDLVFFTPDQMTYNFNFGPALRGLPYTLKIEGHGQYQNLDLESVQNGITMNVSFVINQHLNLKVFGTFQHTKLSDFYNRTIYNDFDYLKKACESQLTPYTGGADSIRVYNASYTTYHDSSNVSMTHKATPSFYGGLIVDYAPTKKLNVNTNFYFYTEQTLLHNKVDDIGRYRDEYLSNPALFETEKDKYSDVYTIKPKLLVNLKVSYKVWNECSVYVNARNLFNDTKREFAFLDKVKGLYMVGVNFSF